MIGSAGHSLVGVFSNVTGLLEGLQQRPCDLICIAGGDGTVSRAASALSGWNVPLVVLPLGTANNTAVTLGFSPRLKANARSWSAAQTRAYDLALVDDGRLRSRFAEAFGWGVFPQAIREAKARRAPETPKQALKRDRRLFRRTAESLAPRSYELTVDGQDHSGSYLLLEIVNLPYIGPRLELSPTSDPGDGLLEVVLAGENERAALGSLAKHGHAPPNAFRTLRGSHISVVADDALAHQDGKLVHHAPGSRRFEVTVELGALTYRCTPSPQ